MTAPDFASVLAAHLWHDRKGQTCGCGWDYERGNGVLRVEQYCAHVAAALDAEVVAWLGSDRTILAAMQALKPVVEHRRHYGLNAEDPEVYARAALAALAQGGGGEGE